jgi:hypothetical protein
MNTKILPDMTFGGDVIWRKIVTLSAFTFDCEKDTELYDRWNKAYPNSFFHTFSIERTEQQGIFTVWLPLLKDNENWKPKYDRYRRTKVPKVLPIAYDDNAINHWLNLAEPFIIENHIISVLS